MKRNADDQEYPKKIEDEKQKLKLNFEVEIFI